MAPKTRILWADDEIDLLKSHILFLEARGYEVTGVTNGMDAVSDFKRERFDIVFLDEQMPGLGGLETLSEIKAVAPDVPIVLITKNEEESLMEDAIGAKIADYLIKPVNPNQILLTVKKIVDGRTLREEKSSQQYLQSFGEITAALNQSMSHAEWIELYIKLVRFDMELEGDEGARQILDDQMRSAQAAFGKYIESVYPDWIADIDQGPSEDRPVLSHEVMTEWVFPLLADKKPVFFFLIDCMRYDQWLTFEQMLFPLFSIKRDFHYSILPTATPYSRNAIFSGLLPDRLAKRFPEAWQASEEDEHSKNRNEESLLQHLLRHKRLDAKSRYEKIVNTDDGRSLVKEIHDFLSFDLSAIVVNFVDILAHSRSDSRVLKEIAPDERAYRALTKTWFEHSWLFQVFQALSTINCQVVITSDHGAVRSLRDTKVFGDKTTSKSLRYKYGKNLKADSRHAIFVQDPHDYALPSTGINTNYIIAKEDYYFVYPTNYHHYQNHYWDSMQHGGVSLHEMILPVLTLTPRALQGANRSRG